MNKFFISTIAFSKLNFEDILSQGEKFGLPLEFSSGIGYRSDLEQSFLDYGPNKMIHNYFPASKESFVLNLASSDENIRFRSVEHCKKGLMLSKISGQTYFSAHCGFCIDPNPSQLGGQLDTGKDFNRSMHLELFSDSLAEILNFARALDMHFCIENNVISKFNIQKDGINPLLCCDSNEIHFIFEKIQNDRLGLLLDTAHLKVSSKTLGNDLISQCNDLSSLIKIIHHSDNNGYTDTNSPLTENYWFLNFMDFHKDKIHVLEVKDQFLKNINLQKTLLGFECN